MSNKTAKPVKPYKDFPMFPDGNGQWAKKIRGKKYYFGVWNDPDGALQKYLAEREDLYAGRTPQYNVGGLTIGDLCAKFLAAKNDLAASGEIAAHTLHDYQDTCRWLEEYFGQRRIVDKLTLYDFTGLRRHLVEKRNCGLWALSNNVQRIRSVFKFAYDQDLIDRPLKFGQVFKKPTKLALRRQRQTKPARMFTHDQLLDLIEHTSLQMQGMILLGLNCGFGNTDCAMLRFDTLDLEGGWINYPRPKSGVNRRCPLWPETIMALREVVARRKPPTDQKYAHFVFLTKYGQNWAKPESRSVANPISHRFRYLLKSRNHYGTGKSFYTLRHVFETIAGTSRDQVAVDSIMGHADSSMAATYRETVDDSRLRAVADTVRTWLGVEKLTVALNAVAASANDGPGSRAA